MILNVYVGEFVEAPAHSIDILAFVVVHSWNIYWSFICYVFVIILCLIKLSIIDIHFAKPTSLSFHSNSVIGFNTIFHFVSTLFLSAPISKLTDYLFCLMIEFEVSAFE